jgi:hypothetical protein
MPPLRRLSSQPRKREKPGLLSFFGRSRNQHLGSDYRPLPSPAMDPNLDHGLNSLLTLPSQFQARNALLSFFRSSFVLF